MSSDNPAWTAGLALTVTRALASALPPGPFATNSYVVESLGFTVRVPDAETVPRPLMVIEFALLVLQLNCALWPCSISAGVAVSDAVGVGGGGVGGIALACFLAQPARNRVATSIANIA